MSFFYRVFTPTEKSIWANEIEAFLEKENVGLTFYGVVEEESVDDLDAAPVELLLFDPDENQIASLVYDSLDDSAFLADEIEEFQDCVDEMLPVCNREWAHEKLAKTKGCYCFTVFDAGFGPANWDRLATLACWLREETNGIEQSDGGQITNESGEVILVVPDDVDVEDDGEGGDQTSVDIAADEQDDVDDFVAALRIDGTWVEKNVDSEEAFAEFLRGEP